MYRAGHASFAGLLDPDHTRPRRSSESETNMKVTALDETHFGPKGLGGK